MTDSLFDFDTIDALDTLDSPSSPPADAWIAPITTDEPYLDGAMARERAIAPPRRAEPLRVDSPHVQPLYLASEGLIALWREAARSDLVTILLPEAIRTLAVIMRDPHATASARVGAAKAVLGVALADSGQQGVKKALHEMTAGEIEDALRAIREEVVTRKSEAKEALELLP